MHKLYFKGVSPIRCPTKKELHLQDVLKLVVSGTYNWTWVQKSPIVLTRFTFYYNLNRYVLHTLFECCKYINKYFVLAVNSVAFTKRIPYATLTAGILCCIGFGIFFGTMYRGATLSALMLDQIFHIYIGW